MYKWNSCLQPIWPKCQTII